MRNPDQIVLATDFSPASAAGIPIASALARLFKARVILLHIFQYVPKHPYRVPVEWMVEIIRRDVRSKLAEAKRKMGIETEVTLLEDGIPAEQVLSYVQACASPLLVMGTHAVGGMERFLLGSTAEEVLRQAQCPVVTVGPHVSSLAANDGYLHKILFATDFGDTSLAAVPFVAALQLLAGAHLRIVHVSTDPASGTVEENRQFDSMREALQANASEEYVTLCGTSISQVIAKEAESYQADLLVLGVRRASAIVAHAPPRITFQLIAASPCAVLTVSS